MDRIEWRSIPSTPNHEVSSIGEVVSFNKGIITLMKPQVHHQGYLTLMITINNKRVKKRIHRSVAEAFIPNPENKPEVNHKNGIKADNTIENLEWCTGSENSKHALRIGLKTMPTRSRKIINTKTKEIYPSVKAAAKSCGFSMDYVWSMINGRYPNKVNLKYYE